MHVLIVYCHPSRQSFTRELFLAFRHGLEETGHTCEVSDLYGDGFVTDMNESEYLREAHYRDDLPVQPDVESEHSKINRCDAIAFVYPLFWTEAPAKLVGWFDRVWTYGFAYCNRSMKHLKRVLFLCVSGHTAEDLEAWGHLGAMKTVMIGDRIHDRAESAEFHLFDGMSRENLAGYEERRERHLRKAFDLGLRL